MQKDETGAQQTAEPATVVVQAETKEKRYVSFSTVVSQARFIIQEITDQEKSKSSSPDYQQAWQKLSDISAMLERYLHKKSEGVKLSFEILKKIQHRQKKDGPITDLINYQAEVVRFYELLLRGCLLQPVRMTDINELQDIIQSCETIYAQLQKRYPKYARDLAVQKIALYIISINLVKGMRKKDPDFFMKHCARTQLECYEKILAAGIRPQVDDYYACARLYFDMGDYPNARRWFLPIIMLFFDDHQNVSKVAHAYYYLILIAANWEKAKEVVVYAETVLRSPFVSCLNKERVAQVQQLLQSWHPIAQQPPPFWERTIRGYDLDEEEEETEDVSLSGQVEATDGEAKGTLPVSGDTAAAAPSQAAVPSAVVSPLVVSAIAVSTTAVPSTTARAIVHYPGALVNQQVDRVASASAPTSASTQNSDGQSLAPEMHLRDTPAVPSASLTPD